MLPAKTRRTTVIPYAGFPSFREWETSVPSIERWEGARASLRDVECCSDILQLVSAIIKDAASSSRNGKTSPGEENTALSLFRAVCEKATLKRGLNATLPLSAQLLAYEHMMDLALNNRPVSERWICKLHLLVTRAQAEQATFKRADGKGQLIRPGQYKESPNHMVRKKGVNLSGVPAELASSEMRRLCRELHGKMFLAAHPILQASYAHYALVLIHPFADGNGRVARWLAFTFIYRSTLIPALSLNKDRGEYVSSLRSADAGNFQPFIELVQNRAVEAMAQIKHGILSATYQASS